MVPARYLAEALGATVEWNGENRAVVVNSHSLTESTSGSLSKDNDIIEIVDGIPMPRDYWKPFNLVGAEYHSKTTFYWEYDNDLYISWYVIENILRDKKEYFLNYDGLIYPTEEDWIQHKKEHKIGQLKILKFKNGDVQVVSIKEVNKTGLINLKWVSKTQTLYVSV